MLTELRQVLSRTAKEIVNTGGPILIVEDNDDDQRLLWREVKFLFGDVPVQTFTNGVQLLDYLKRKAEEGEAAKPPRLILLDLYMPKMDGFKTLDKLAADAATANIPVVVISGTRSDDEMEKARLHGAHAFLSKPFSRDQWVFF
ncbi:MAG: response regulator [Alphaproteobacteria bacterium]